MDFIINPVTYVLQEVVPQFHIILQLLLAILVVWIFLKESDKEYVGSSKETDSIIEGWNPKPLVDSYSKDYHCLQPRIVDKKIGKYVFVNGIKCLNVSSYNFLGLLENSLSEDLAIKAVRKYGIGSCGPRGFYGTVDVHLQIEEELAKFFSVEEALVYSYGFSAVASAIPAYAKRSDIIFVDQNVNFAIQKGLDASRSEIVYFEHNNVDHLEELLKKQVIIDTKNKTKSRKARKFLVIEGIYSKTGDVCPLPELMKLKKKYKLRLFIDESISFGTLGDFGRGITEYFNIPIQDVDLIMGSMENSLASIGGFCAGSAFIVEHQRLSGLGYCFSASLPPLLTVAAITNLQALDGNPSLVKDLNRTCKIVHDYLSNSDRILEHFVVKGDDVSPIKHLVPLCSRIDDLINHVVEFCLKAGVAICGVNYLAEDKEPRQRSIRLSIANSLTIDDIKFVIKTIEDSLEHFV